MAWPYDANIRTFGALQQVPSNDLNEIQERIVDLHRVRVIDSTIGLLPTDATAAGWAYELLASISGFGYRATTGNGAGTEAMVFPIHTPDGYRLNTVEVKTYATNVGYPRFTLYGLDSKIASSATAPVPGVLSSAATPGGTGWNTLTLTPTVTPAVITADLSVYVLADIPYINDEVIAVQANYYPITPTP